MMPTHRSPRRLIAIALLGTSTGTAAAPDLDPAGVWQVVSYTAEDPATGASTQPFGELPTGTAIYTANGHMSILVTGRTREAPSGTAAEDRAARAGLLDSMYAYAGSFKIAGTTLTIHVESAWQPSWVGADKVRTLQIDHDVLTITTPPMVSPVDGKTYISVTRFKRLESPTRSSARQAAAASARPQSVPAKAPPPTQSEVPP